MRKFFIFLFAFAALCLVALYFAMPPIIESAVRENLANLPATLNRPGVSSWSAPEVGKVKFNFLQRKLILEKAILRGYVDDPEFGRINMVYRLEELEGTMPWRLLFLLGPLQNLASAPYGFETVLNRLEGKDISIALDSAALRVESVIGLLTGKDLRFEGNLLGSLLNGVPLDYLDFIYGTAIEELRAENVMGNISNPVTGELVTHKIGSANLVGWQGQKINSFYLEKVALNSPNENLFALAKMEISGISLPALPLAVALQTEFLNKNPFGIIINLREMFIGQPIVSKISITELATKNFSCKSARGDWLSTQPMAWNIALEDVVMPASLVQDETGLVLKGLESVKLNCNMSAEENAAHEIEHKGAARSGNLASFVWSFNTSSTPTSILKLLQTRISSFNLDYDDSGLLARVAAGLAPNAQAAMFALKIAAGKFCSRNNPQNVALRSSLESFIEQPGRIVIRGRAPFTFTQIGTQAYMGNLGAIFEAVATPGKLTLDEEFDALSR